MQTWYLLPDARQKTLRWWLGGTALFFVFLLVQTATGKISGMALTAWGWWAASLLPGLLMLSIGTWLHYNPSKIIHPTALKTNMAITIGYLGVVLLVFLSSQAAVESNDFGLENYFLRSLGLLLPLEAFVLFGNWLLFFNRKGLFRPNPQIILDLAANKAGTANKRGNIIQAQCYELVASSDLQAVFKHLEKVLGKGHQQLTLLQSQYHNLVRENDLGTVEPAQSQLALNRLTVAVLNLISEI